jgi:hypothetical protein
MDFRDVRIMRLEAEIAQLRAQLRDAEERAFNAESVARRGSVERHPTSWRPQR